MLNCTTVLNYRISRLFKLFCDFNEITDFTSTSSDLDNAMAGNTNLSCRDD